MTRLRSVALSALLLLSIRTFAAEIPRRDFGPDTTSTGDPHTGRGIVAPGLTCEPAGRHQPMLCSGYLESDLDGTMLEVRVWVPLTGPAHPLVVGIHGWGGSWRSMRRYAQRITDEGYTFLAYSTRGFGESYGQVNLADVNVEAADLRSLIGQVADHPRLRVDPSSVAVFGASYGGAHAWLAALQPSFTSPRGRTVTVRTIASLVPWTELTGALRPNGRRHQPIDPAGGFKFSFVEGLYIGGCRDAPLCSNYPDYLRRWNAWMIATEPSNSTPTDREIVDGFSGYRSVYWQQPFWDRVVNHPLPIFLAQGWTDDLFPPDEALRMYDVLKSINPNYPIALYLGDVGHPRARNKPEEVDFVIDQLFGWFAWYLKGEGTQPPLDVQAAITRRKDVPFNPADVIRVPTYDHLATAILSHSFAADPKVITFNPGNTGGVIWDPFVMLGSEELAYWPGEVPSEVVPGNVAVYEIPVSQLSPLSSLLVAGQPSVTLTLNQQSPLGYREQLNVRLFSVRDGKPHLVTRGTYTIDTGNPVEPIGTATVTVPTYGNLWELTSSDTLRLEITNVDSPYIEPSKVASITEITNVRLTIPIR